MHYNAYDAGKNFRNVLIFCFETNILIFLLNFKFLAFKSLFRIQWNFYANFSYHAVEKIFKCLKNSNF